MLPQYRHLDDDPKVHHPSLPLPSLSVVNFGLIILLFVLVIWLGSRHYHVTQTAVQHHLGQLKLKSEGGESSPSGGSFVLQLEQRSVGAFSRYPETSSIPELAFDQVASYRLCCTIRGETEGSWFRVCDYGPGATQNVGLECLLHSDDG